MNETRTTVFRYGLLAPTDGGAVVREQMRRACRYRNARVEIERARRAEVCAGVLSPRPEEAYRTLLARAGEHGEEPVFWGTRQLVDDALARSFRSLPLSENPRFLRFDGTGAVGIQLHRGLAVASVAGDRHMSVAMAPDAREGRRRGTRALLRMRIASGDVCAVWPMTLHRPLPPDGEIRNVRVVLRRVGPREIWEVMITVNASAPVPVATEGVVAVHCGWRRMGDERRVGYWGDADGDGATIMVSERVVTGGQKASSLRAIRDCSLPVAREAVGDGVTAVAAGVLRAEERPQQWRSPARFAALAKRWRRVDAAAASALEDWRYRDHHLWAWESEQREKGLGERREGFRVLAARLASRYHTLVIEKIDLAQMAVHGAAGGGRVQSGPSLMRLAMVQAFRARGGRVVEVPSVWITGRCADCGHVDEVDKMEVEHTCSVCGTSWDRDRNAVRNMLACERSGGGEARTAKPRTKLRLPRRQTRAAREAAEKAAKSQGG